MPVVVPRKSAPAPKPVEPQAPPAAPAPEWITRKEAQAMLDRQASDFKSQLKAMAEEFARQLAASAPKPASGWDFKVEYLNNGEIDAIRATPRAKASAP